MSASMRRACELGSSPFSSATTAASTVWRCSDVRYGRYDPLDGLFRYLSCTLVAIRISAAALGGFWNRAR